MSSIEEYEVLHEQMRVELVGFEKAIVNYRLEWIRRGKVIELLKRVRALESSPDAQKVMELAEDVGL